MATLTGSRGPLSSRILPEVLRTVTGASLLVTYQPIGTPLLHPIRIAKFTNITTEVVFLSWDGINDNEILNIGESFTLQVSTNRESSLPFDIAQGTQFYVRAAAAGTGNLYISCYYGA